MNALVSHNNSEPATTVVLISATIVTDGFKRVK